MSLILQYEVNCAFTFLFTFLFCLQFLFVYIFSSANFLLEATPHDRSSTPVKLLRFLDTNLIFLKNWLVPENFSRVLTSVWTTSTFSLAKIIEQSIVDRQDVKYFSHLHHVFAVLLNFFHGGEIPEQNPR